MESKPLHNAWTCCITSTLPISTPFFCWGGGANFQWVTYLPPSTISRTWIFSSPSVCVETAEGGEKKHRDSSGAVYIWHFSMFNLGWKVPTLRSFYFSPWNVEVDEFITRRYLKRSLFSYVAYIYVSMAILAYNKLHNTYRHMWRLLSNVQTCWGRKSEWTEQDRARGDLSGSSFASLTFLTRCCFLHPPSFQIEITTTQGFKEPELRRELFCGFKQLLGSWRQSHANKKTSTGKRKTRDESQISPRRHLALSSSSESLWSCLNKQTALKITVFFGGRGGGGGVVSSLNN